MKSALTIATLVLVGLVSTVRPAQANIWDWMQEWSGPGPFRTGGNGSTTICRVEFDENHRSVQEEHPCIFIDFRNFVPTDDAKDNFPVTVTASFLDVGWTWRLWRPVEVGVGLGLMRANGIETAVRPTITAFRGVVKPVLLGAELVGKVFPGKVSHDLLTNHERKPSRIFHVLKFYVRENILLFLNGEDLGVMGTPFDRKFEFVPSHGFLLDFGELLFPDLSGAR